MRLAWVGRADVDTETRSLCFPIVLTGASCLPFLFAEDETFGRAGLRLILSLVALLLLASGSVASFGGTELFVRSGVRRLLLLTGAAIEVGRRKALSRFVGSVWCFASGCSRAGLDMSLAAGVPVWDTCTTGFRSLISACSAGFLVLASTVGCTAWAFTETS
jgi:hypothetical protein